MVLIGNSMGIAVKFGINTTSVVLEMVFIPNFTATHAITSTNWRDQISQVCKKCLITYSGLTLIENHFQLPSLKCLLTLL